MRIVEVMVVKEPGNNVFMVSGGVGWLGGGISRWLGGAREYCSYRA